HQNLTVIAITGSSGKTTCKEMLGSIFGRLAPTLITRGNLNNDLGVPMMLLELSDHHRYAILELGANHIGEIAYTTEIV
ncbi:Mur ligase family protein, partial [Psychrobacter sp. TB20-MNA-CIBAN-0197]